MSAPVNIKAATPAARAQFKQPWPTTVKDADLERILERLDRIIRDVEPLIAHLCDRLGIDMEDGDTEELSDTDEEASENESKE